MDINGHDSLERFEDEIKKEVEKRREEEQKAKRHALLEGAIPIQLRNLGIHAIASQKPEIPNRQWDAPWRNASQEIDAERIDRVWRERWGE